MKLLYRTALAPIFFLLLACAAQGQEFKIDGFKIGFDGRYKAGFWTACSVEITPTQGASKFEGQLEIVAPDGDGVPVRYISELETDGKPQRLHGLIKTGRMKPRIEVRITREGKILARRTFTAAAGGDFPPALPGVQEMVLSIGGDIGVSDALAQQRRSDDLPVVAITVKDNASLPVNWLAYEAFETITLAGGTEDALAGMTSQQVAAIDQWVSMGGQLIFTVGASSKRLLAEDAVAGGALKTLAPGDFESIATLRRTSAIENFSGNPPQALDTLAAEQRTPLSLTTLTAPRGVVLVEEGTSRAKAPVIISTAHNFGVIKFVCLDLDTAPVKDWSGRPRMVLNLLHGDQRTQVAEAADNVRGQASHSGFNDISGQLRNALDQFQGVLLTPFSWVAAILGVYLLIIGPADYFLLKRFAPGMHFTWISFPLVVGLFCAGALGLSFWRQGSPTRINQVDIVDICFDEEGQAVATRGITWANIYSPQSQRVQLQAVPGDPAINQFQGAALSWQGLTGDGLGSMGVNTLAVSNAAYAINTSQPQFQVEGAPLQTASSKSFGLRWWGKSELRMRGRFRPNTSIDSLRSGIINPLDETLFDCRVYYGGWAYRFEKPIGPGEPLQISDAARERKLQWHLTRKLIDLNHADTAQQWRTDTPVPRILEVQMFHEAAGGRGYTRLHGRFQPYVDLSHHLDLNRAIVVCRVKKPAVQLDTGQDRERDGDQQWTYYRLITPVIPGEE